MVANKPIKSGDTVAVENPFAAVLYPDKAGTNCDNCFVKLRSAVPCPMCAGVAFCSVSCRDQALSGRYDQNCHQYQSELRGFNHGPLGLHCTATVSTNEMT